MSIEVNPDEPFHVVHQGNVLTVTLEQLADAYQADQVADETLIWQEGFQEWMRLDTLLHTLEQQDGPVSAAPEVADDIFHVMVAPEEIKQMSLDLLADAYRFDVIDDDTLVWQSGFTEWLPISALLGPEDDHVSIAPSMPPAYNSGHVAAPSAPSSVPPPSIAARAPSIPAPSMPASSAPVPSIVTAMPSAPSAPMQRAPDFNLGSVGAVDDSLAPAADWSIIPQQQKASPWYARSLVAIAALGAFLVSYRAGIIESGPNGPEPGSLLAQVEAKVGAPGVDTVQGLDRWLAQLEQTHGLNSLSETVPVPEEKGTFKKAELPTEEEAKKAVAESESKETSAKDEADAASGKKDSGAASAFSSSLSGTPKKAAAAPVRRQVRPSSSSSSGTKWKGAAGHEYDPMNGAL